MTADGCTARSSADKPLFGTRRSRPNFCDRLALGRRQAHNFLIEVFGRLPRTGWRWRTRMPWRGPSTRPPTTTSPAYRAECRRSGCELGFEACRLKRELPERRNSMLHRVLREEAHQLRGRVRAPWVGT